MCKVSIEARSPGAQRQDLRNGRRSLISLPATIELYGQRHSARLHNLSSKGAMVYSSALVSADDHIKLTCGTIEARGRVIWSNAERFGVEFHVPLDDENVARQLSRCNAMMSRRIQREAAREDSAES
jgi:hypothetical protein